MSNNRSMTDPEPSPKPGTGDTWALVIEDMRQRREDGIAQYGMPLQPDNGRDSLTDAYQEALDFCVYVRNAKEYYEARIRGLLKIIADQQREIECLKGGRESA